MLRQLRFVALACLLLPACAFRERPGLTPCTTTDQCGSGQACVDGVCLIPRDASVDPVVDQGEDTTVIDGLPFDLPPDAPPNIVILAPKPNEILPGGSFKFAATVAMPGAGVIFRWKYPCAGINCNPCVPPPPPVKMGTTYELTMQVVATTMGELCAGKPLADHSRGGWFFEVQVGAEKVSVPFTIP